MNDDLIWKMIKAYNTLGCFRSICPTCNGTGHKLNDPSRTKPSETAECSDCRGRGYWDEYPPHQFSRMQAAAAILESALHE